MRIDSNMKYSSYLNLYALFFYFYTIYYFILYVAYHTM